MEVRRLARRAIEAGGGKLVVWSDVATATVVRNLHETEVQQHETIRLGIVDRPGESVVTGVAGQQNAPIIAQVRREDDAGKCSIRHSAYC